MCVMSTQKLEPTRFDGEHYLATRHDECGPVGVNAGLRVGCRDSAQPNLVAGEARGAVEDAMGCVNARTQMGLPTPERSDSGHWHIPTQGAGAAQYDPGTVQRMNALCISI